MLYLYFFAPPTWYISFITCLIFILAFCIWDLLIFLPYQSFDLLFRETSSLYCLWCTFLFCYQIFLSFPNCVSAFTMVCSLPVPSSHSSCLLIFYHDPKYMVSKICFLTCHLQEFLEPFGQYIPSYMLWCLIGSMFGFFILTAAWHLPICGI